MFSYVSPICIVKLVDCYTNAKKFKFAFQVKDRKFSFNTGKRDLFSQLHCMLLYPAQKLLLICSVFEAVSKRFSFQSMQKTACIVLPNISLCSDSYFFSFSLSFTVLFTSNMLPNSAFITYPTYYHSLLVFIFRNYFYIPSQCM